MLLETGEGRGERDRERDREGEREREREIDEREKDQLFAFSDVPQLGIEPQTWAFALTKN